MADSDEDVAEKLYPERMGFLKIADVNLRNVLFMIDPSIEIKKPVGVVDEMQYRAERISFDLTQCLQKLDRYLESFDQDSVFSDSKKGVLRRTLIFCIRNHLLLIFHGRSIYFEPDAPQFLLTHTERVFDAYFHIPLGIPTREVVDFNVDHPGYIHPRPHHAGGDRRKAGPSEDKGENPIDKVSHASRKRGLDDMSSNTEKLYMIVIMENLHRRLNALEQQMGF